MNDMEFAVFEQLFKEAVKKCFGHELTEPLSETESKLFYNKIFEDTGLVVGWKSLKNYSIYISDRSKPENPSIPTLDTLARYVEQAPYTDETNRKDKEGHYPYWFAYKNRVISSHSAESTQTPVKIVFFKKKFIAAGLVLLIIAALFFFLRKTNRNNDFEVDFSTVFTPGEKEWKVKDFDTMYWNKRNETPGYLSLFTLRGDNWPDTSEKKTIIKNLIYRPINNDCFTAEIQIKDFVPNARWHQAGLLLMEDSSLSSKCIRLSLGYNDYFGGFTRSPEIIIQGITSSNESGKPEEFIHHFLISTDSLTGNPVLAQNLSYSSLRIEKKGHQFRFLYGGGGFANGALHEINTKLLDIRPKYIAIFALKGFIEDKNVQKVLFKSLSIKGIDCP